jgi:hypothetical protein
LIPFAIRSTTTFSAVAFYIFAIMTNGKHSKAIVRNDPTDLSLLSETPFKCTFFAYVACHVTVRTHSMLELGCELPAVPLPAAALTRLGPALSLSLSHFFPPQMLLAAAATASLPPARPPPQLGRPAARPHRRRNVAEDGVFQLECVDKAGTRWWLACGCNATAGR